VENPAAHAFWTISNEARPLTARPSPSAGTLAVEHEPAGDLVDGVVATDVLPHLEQGCPSASKAAAACTAPVEAKRPWPPRIASGTAARHSPGRTERVAIGAIRSTRSSMATEPHSPHELVLVVRAGRQVGARPPVDTDTTLNFVSTADPVPQ
jgi:hypothetical protein